MLGLFEALRFLGLLRFFGLFGIGFSGLLGFCSGCEGF